MGERKFTFVEYHSHGTGPSFFPDLIRSSGDHEDDEAEEMEETDDSGGNVGRILLALVVLIGVAVAVKYFTGNDEPEPTIDTEEVAVTEYED